jgi:hypothetical protein
MREAVPGVPISDEAVRLMKLHLETVGRTLSEAGSQILGRENAMRKQIGERQRMRLSPKHVKMAIDGKLMSGGNQDDQSQKSS